MDQLKCKECGGPLVSIDTFKLRDGRMVPMETMTLVGYMSPPGHDHDDNCLKRVYLCAAGHQTCLSIRRRCSTEGCDWAGKTECWCHEDAPQKVDSWPDLPLRVT